MDIYESLEKIKKDKNKSEFDKFKNLSVEAAEQGFDENSITEILTVHGCSNETAKSLASFSQEDIPQDYSVDVPPESFHDLVDKVEETILAGNIDEIKNYLDKYAGNEFSETLSRILLARDSGTQILVSEVVQELEPLIDGIVVMNKIAAKDTKIADMNEKEKMEMHLWGVWPVNLIQKRENIDSIDQRIQKKTEAENPHPGTNISFF